MGKKLTTNDFIEKARKIHGNRYDYSKVNYVNYDTDVCIICPKHGEFWQKPIHHLTNRGCPLCGKEKAQKDNAERNEKARNDFVEKARKIHGDKYNYSKVNYINSHTNVCIICPEHGEFWQKPTNHLSGNACPECGGHMKKTVENFIEGAKRVHGDKYNYSKVEYLNNHTKVCIICPQHGEFWQTPANHLKGDGCPKCKTSIMENKVIKKLGDENIDFIYEYRPSFLNNGKSHQSIDFYLPKHNIGIECQGKQHFEPIDFAGKGEKWASMLFVNNVRRDKIKKELCKKNGIEIFYINYNENVNNKLEEILSLCNFLY